MAPNVCRQPNTAGTNKAPPEKKLNQWKNWLEEKGLRVSQAKTLCFTSDNNESWMKSNT